MGGARGGSPVTRVLLGMAVISILAGAALSEDGPESRQARAGDDTAARVASPAADVAAGVEAAPASATEVLFLYGDRLRAADREGALGLLVPRLDESNTLMDDEMRRWSEGLLDFVVLDQHVEGDVAIFPIVWTG